MWGGRQGGNRGQMCQKKGEGKMRSGVETMQGRGREWSQDVLRQQSPFREHSPWSGHHARPRMILSNPHPPRVSAIMPILQMK